MKDFFNGFLSVKVYFSALKLLLLPTKLTEKDLTKEKNKLIDTEREGRERVDLVNFCFLKAENLGAVFMMMCV